jgi:hypothetical protein
METLKYTADNVLYEQWADIMRLKNETCLGTWFLFGKKSYPFTSDYGPQHGIVFEDRVFSCVETAYKYAKYFIDLDPATMTKPQSEFLRLCLDPDMTGQYIRRLEKVYAPSLQTSPVWQNDSQKQHISLRYSTMKSIVNQKLIQNPQTLQCLYDTGSAYIIAPSFAYSQNGKPWSDRLWEVEYDLHGNALGGENWHGHILMELRKELLGLDTIGQYESIAER